MNFISPLYGVFLVSVLGIYWNVPDRQLKLWTLLLASLVFYSSLNIQYLPLLLVLTFLNYRLGLELGQSKYLEKISQNANNSSEEWQLAQSDWNQRKLKILCLGTEMLNPNTKLYISSYTSSKKVKYVNKT
ncbi:hypothetical protein [Richelia sinica]|uniref:hypothetical protein n=1 Tax=Richelia sinica TaxID=1357545 RepID=UPI001685B222|nr:hypothetical protein [Richelia sinica]MBD2666591.1 hypothetical protein [Richelia sinica FACHB-800]